MCARYELNRAVGSAEQLAWAGFAKVESLAWWKRKGGELVDMPADRFAERSDIDGSLIWADGSAGNVIRGLIDPNNGQALLKIVTRASTPTELQRFQHSRICVIEPPLFSAERIPVEADSEREPSLGALLLDPEQR